MNARPDQFQRRRSTRTAGDLLSRLSIRTRLFANAGIYAATLGGLGIVALVGRAQWQAGMDTLLDGVALQRDAMEMDMMHDAIRGDVLFALSGDVGTSSAELSEHETKMKASITAIRERHPSQPVLDQLDGTQGAVDDYLSRARAIVALAPHDRAGALAAMPEFQGQFSHLEDELSELGDIVAAHAAEEKAASAAATDRIAFGVGGAASIAGIMGGLASLLIARGIHRSIDRMMRSLVEFADGDCTTEAEVLGEDEVAAMATAFNTCVDNTAGTIRGVTAGANALSGAAGGLARTAEVMSREVASMGSQLQTTSSGAEQVSSNVQAVAMGMDAMSAAMNEIARNAVQAARVAGAAVQTAQGTSEAIGRLGESGEEIGKFVKVISTIAHQTNLLALNATIEAARAGEAGRGFAVVANEVKELARETAKATEDISRKIEAIQQDTRTAVESNEQIAQVIGQINDLQTAIAGAVEEQTATTREIARNLQEAAQGSASVATGVADMARSAQATSAGAGEFEQSTQRLAKLGSELESTCARFRT